MTDFGTRWSCSLSSRTLLFASTAAQQGSLSTTEPMNTCRPLHHSTSAACPGRWPRRLSKGGTSGTLEASMVRQHTDTHTDRQILGPSMKHTWLKAMFSVVMACLGRVHGAPLPQRPPEGPGLWPAAQGGPWLWRRGDCPRSGTAWAAWDGGGCRGRGTSRDPQGYPEAWQSSHG